MEETIQHQVPVPKMFFHKGIIKTIIREAGGVDEASNLRTPFSIFSLFSCKDYVLRLNVIVNKAGGVNGF